MTNRFYFAIPDCSGGPSSTSVPPLAPPGGSTAVYYAHYLIIMGLGLHPTVKFRGACDIWFVEISNMNPRNVIKKSYTDHLLQGTCYYTNDWFHELYKAGWQKRTRAQTEVEASIDLYIPWKLPIVIVEKLCFFNEASSSKRVVLHWDPLESTICSAISMFRVSINLWKFRRNCCRIRLLWIWYTSCRGSNSLNWYGKSMFNFKLSC